MGGLSFPFPFIDRLTFPTDASSGTRIVIDGINGRIEFYDAGNNLVGVLRSDPTPAQYWGSAVGARVQLEPAQISIIDSTSSERIVIDAASTPPDITYDGFSYPRGQATLSPFFATGNDVPRAAGALTDMTFTASLHAGRLYRFPLHTQVQFGTAGATYELSLDQNGATVGKFARWVPAMTPAGSTIHVCNAFCELQPATDQLGAIFTVRNSASSGGTVTCQAVGVTPRHFTCEDMGAF